MIARKTKQAVERVQDSARDNISVMLAMAALGAISAAMWSLVMLGISHMQDQLEASERRLMLHDDERGDLIMSMHNTDIGKINVRLISLEEHVGWSRLRWERHAVAEDECSRERQQIRDRVRDLESICDQ